MYISYEAGDILPEGTRGWLHSMEPIVDKTSRAKERNNLTIKKPVQSIIENITKEALLQGVDPFAPLAIAHKEGGFGTIRQKGHSAVEDYTNPMHVNPSKEGLKRMMADFHSNRNSNPLYHEAVIGLRDPNLGKHYSQVLEDVSREAEQRASIKEGIKYYKDNLDLNEGSMWHGLRNYNGAGPRAREYAGHVSELHENLKKNNPHVVDMVSRITEEFNKSKKAARPDTSIYGAF